MYITTRFDKLYNEILLAIKHDLHHIDTLLEMCDALDVEAITPNMTVIAECLREYLEDGLVGEIL